MNCFSHVVANSFAHSAKTQLASFAVWLDLYRCFCLRIILQSGSSTGEALLLRLTAP